MAGAGVEGVLLVDLGWYRGCVGGVSIKSTRPLSMPRIFCGKGPAEVAATLPLIYSVCAVAQGCAAAEALEQALNLPVPPAYRKRRRLLVAFETLKEHVWRIELDWAKFLNRSAAREGVVRVVSLMKDFRSALFPEGDPFTPGGYAAREPAPRFDRGLDDLEQLLQARIFSRPTQNWLKIPDREGLIQWSREGRTLAQELLLQVQNSGEAGLGRNGVPALSALDAAYLNRRLTAPDADQFVAQPDWCGMPMETTPYTRRRSHPMLHSLERLYGNGLLTRVTARLVELAALVGELRAGVADLDSPERPEDGNDTGPGIGIAQLEAARGRLVHRVILESGRVADYRILAPTEWNFHSRGVLANGLAGLEAASEMSLKKKADLLINAIDPCVGYQLRIHRSEGGAGPARE